jgi:glycosyltransferase involved in cell wall biosynthesis
MTHPSAIYVVIPAYKEAARLGLTLASLDKNLYTVVVVDDGSPDATRAIAYNAGVWVIRHPINRGQGAALKTGIDFAVAQGADYIVTFDADGQHDAREIPALLQPLLEGRADIVLGSRFIGKTINMPWSRYLTLKLAVLFTRIVSQIHVSDTHNGFRAMTRDAAAALVLHQDRMAHASEILDEIQRLKLRYLEVPVTIRYSQDTIEKGQSSLAAVRIAWQFLIGRLFK